MQNQFEIPLPKVQMSACLSVIFNSCCIPLQNAGQNIQFSPKNKGTSHSRLLVTKYCDMIYLSLERCDKQTHVQTYAGNKCIGAEGGGRGDLTSLCLEHKVIRRQ